MSSVASNRSFSVAPWALPKAFISGIDSVQQANERFADARPVITFGIPAKGSERPSAPPMPIAFSPGPASMPYSPAAEVAVAAALLSTPPRRAPRDGWAVLSRARFGTPSHSARTLRSVGEVASQFEIT